MNLNPLSLAFIGIISQIVFSNEEICNDKMVSWMINPIKITNLFSQDSYVIKISLNIKCPDIKSTKDELVVKFEDYDVRLAHITGTQIFEGALSLNSNEYKKKKNYEVSLLKNNEKLSKTNFIRIEEWIGFLTLPYFDILISSLPLILWIIFIQKAYLKYFK